MDKVLVLTGNAAVIVRPSGGRAFDEIPGSELEEVLNRVYRDTPSLSDNELFRGVIKHYGMGRLTTNMVKTLERLLQNQRENSADRNDAAQE